MADLSVPVVNTASKKLEKPIVEGSKIIFTNGKGEKVTLTHPGPSYNWPKESIKRNQNWAMELMTAFDGFYNEETGSVPIEKISEVGDFIDTLRVPVTDVSKSDNTDWNRVFRNALSDYTHPKSDGGENITAKEIQQFYDRCASIITRVSRFTINIDSDNK